VNLAKIAIDKKMVTYFVTFLLVVAGIASFFSLGQLEDPSFSIKTAVVVTTYPGATAEEVELEVTDRIETALQQLKQLDYVKSFSAPGYSQIWVNIKTDYWADRLPQVWDEMRRKIRDIEESLPPGANRPIVNDDFGDVYGLLLALTGDGFSYAEMENAAKGLKKELSLVDGVAKVDFWGVQQKVIYLEASDSQLSQVGMSDLSLIQTLQQQNVVVDAGSVNLRDKRIRVTPTGVYRSPEDIGEVTVIPSLIDSLQTLEKGQSAFKSDELIRVRDLGTVKRGYLDPPRQLMRLNGQPALAISLTNISGVNVVDVGKAVDARLAELVAELPIGLELQKVHWMSDVVDASISGFFVSLAEAVAIVLVVLAVSMGWRMGVLIGLDLLLTILGTFIVMSMMGFDLQRMSLGALVIALGMMVDNSIVVADGYVMLRQQGKSKEDAAIEAAGKPAMPLLGATIVAIMAFYPIGGSTDSTGEYCKSLFLVVGISLIISWLISMTLTPIKCIDMLPDPKAGEDKKDPYGGKLFVLFRSLLEKTLRFRVLFMGCMLALLVASGFGFGFVEQLFFPDSSMTKFMIDLYNPQGTRIEVTSQSLIKLEDKLKRDERVEAVTSFIGSGPPRFYLPVEPEKTNPAYAQLIVNVKSLKDIDPILVELDPWTKENFPDSLVMLRKFAVGPGQTWKFQARISGPATADSNLLRAQADKVLNILRDESLIGAIETDWRQKVPRLVPIYNQERGQWAGVSREDLANSTKRAYDGRNIGLFREGDEMIPIILRHPESDRESLGSFDVLQIQPGMSTSTVPMAQITDDVKVDWEEQFIWRRDRRRTITIQANPVLGQTLPTVMAKIKKQVETIDLPPGYSFNWGGETEDQARSQAGLVPGVIPAFAVILFIIIALFNAFRPPLVIICTIPFALIGITGGLLGFGAPFGFMALLGAMSLAGMMIKNAIVLLDEVNSNVSLGKSQYDSVMEAAVARLRPVVLAAATTVLGVVPLLQDVFWVGMAIAIMAGLTVGTFLTMFVVPVLYCIFFKVPSPKAN
jgi:multidrug efflux pump subunit AcrB